MMFAVARFSIDGFHCWPEAPQRRSYLSVRHRHLFMIEIKVEVTHDGRDVECHDLAHVGKRSLDHLNWEGRGHEFGNMSCESIARLIAGHVGCEWGNRKIIVAVLEDGENGAEYIKD